MAVFPQPNLSWKKEKKKKKHNSGQMYPGKLLFLFFCSLPSFISLSIISVVALWPLRSMLNVEEKLV